MHSTDEVKLDLVKYCHTFPLAPDNEIFRESIIRNLAAMFNSKKTVILIEGPYSSGKTILLSQFSRFYSDRTISYFIKEDYWVSNVSGFLIDMCEQMLQISELNKDGKLDDLSISDLNESDLKRLFRKLYLNLISQAKKLKGPFYFVIDGLNLLQNNYGEESILKYLPTGDSAGIYVLVSSIKGEKYNFSYEIIPMQLFAREEAEKYLSDCLGKNQISKVYDACDGMPGYLEEIRRQIREDTPISFEKLPEGFNNLLEKEWIKLNIDINVTNILSILTYFNNSIDYDALKNILTLEDDVIDTIISNISFIKFNKDNNSIELVKAYRPFLSEKLKNNQLNVYNYLINYYEKNTDDQKYFLHLPSLYEKVNDYESLVKLLNVDSIMRFLGTEKKFFLVRRNFHILSEMAYQKKEYQRLTWSSLAESFFVRLITNPPAFENEIKALLSLNDIDKALKLSNSSVLPEDRLELLVIVCKHMTEKNISIPNDLYKILEETIDLIDNIDCFSEKMIDKLFYLCSELFSLKVELGEKLLNHIGKDDNIADIISLIENVNKKILDSLESNDLFLDSINNISIEELSSISIKNLYSIEGSDIHSLIEQVDKISNIQLKIHLLQSWCNVNKENPNVLIVINKTLLVMSETEIYTPTLADLRKLAQSLQNNNIKEDISKIINEIDILKTTAIRSPIDEFVRLELILATIEKRLAIGNAESRLYEVYLILDEVSDYDQRCIVLIRMLISLKDILPDDNVLRNEIKNQLRKDYMKLLECSAEHYHATKIVLEILTLYDHHLAIYFASLLNLEIRRDSAYARIIFVYVSNRSEDYNLNFIIDNVVKIKNPHKKEYLIVNILKQISNNTKYLNKYYKLFKLVEMLESNIGRSYALSYYLSIIEKYEDSKVDNLKISLIQSIDKIDSLMHRQNVAFTVVSIVSNYKDLALKIFERAIQYKNYSALSDNRLYELYIESCELAISMVPDIIRDPEYNEKIGLIYKAIELIPSSYQRSSLTCDLALRALLTGREDIFNEYAKVVLEIIEKCLDDESIIASTVYISPLLYEYERTLFFEKIESLNDTYRTIALNRVVKFLLSGQLPDVIVDMEKIKRNVDFPTALKVCELLNKMNDDVSIYSAISSLTNLLIDHGKNFKSILIDKHLLIIAEKLSGIIKQKLPDKKNIKHQGYVITCNACVSKIRDLNKTARSNKKWNDICLSWGELGRKALEIENPADRAYILKCNAINANIGQPNYSEKFLGEAEDCLSLINNHIDRIERYNVVAKGYAEISNYKAFEDLLEKSIEMAKIISNSEYRDQLIGEIIESAYSYNPTFANDIAGKADNFSNKINPHEKVIELNLHSNPQKIEQYGNKKFGAILNRSLRNILKSVYSGRSIIQHDDVIARWIYNSLGQDFDTVKLATTWLIENTIISKKSINDRSYLNILFNGIIQLLHMTLQTNSVLSQTVATINKENSLNNILLPNVVIFSVGQKKEELSWVMSWLAKNTKNYVKIYDPYFSENDLELLRALSTDIRVQILTSIKIEKLNNIQERYKKMWHSICDQKPPETHIFTFATNSGQTPMHDRYIVTDDSGLKIGTSINGFGNKDTSITFMNNEEKTEIERKIIDSFISNPPYSYKGERLVIRTYTLEYGL